MSYVEHTVNGGGFGGEKGKGGGSTKTQKKKKRFAERKGYVQGG